MGRYKFIASIVIALMLTARLCASADGAVSADLSEAFIAEITKLTDCMGPDAKRNFFRALARIPEDQRTENFISRANKLCITICKATEETFIALSRIQPHERETIVDQLYRLVRPFYVHRMDQSVLSNAFIALTSVDERQREEFISQAGSFFSYSFGESCYLKVIRSLAAVPGSRRNDVFITFVKELLPKPCSGGGVAEIISALAPIPEIQRDTFMEQILSLGISEDDIGIKIFAIKILARVNEEERETILTRLYSLSGTQAFYDFIRQKHAEQEAAPPRYEPPPPYE